MKKSFLNIFFLILPIVVFSQQSKYELTRVEFIGNNKISSTLLASTIYSKQSPGAISQLLNKVVDLGGPPVFFDSLLIQEDVSALKQYYQSHGYYKTKIKSSYSLDTVDQQAGLVYTIDEGDFAILKSYTIEGFERIAPEFREYLTDYIIRDTNRVYEESVITTKNNYAVTYLKDNGYMLARADIPTIKVDTIKNRVDAILNYIVGERYEISDIKTTRTGVGMNDVGDDLIKDIAGINVNDTFSSSEIRRGQTRLLRTNLFTSVYIYNLVSDTVGSKVPLSIIVDVGKMNELSPEVIMNNDYSTFNLGLGLNYIRKNFLGGARKLALGTSVTTQNVTGFLKKFSFTDSTFYGQADFRVSIEQPFLFGQPINTKLETYYTLQKKRQEYNQTLSGIKLSFDFELPGNVYLTSLNTYFNLERSDYDYYEGVLPNFLRTFLLREGFTEEMADQKVLELFKDPSKTNKFSSTNVIMGATFGANKTNDFLYPTSGYSLSFLIEDINSLAAIYSKVFGQSFDKPQSIKMVVTSTFYPDLYGSKSDALGIKIRIGNIITYRGDQINLPYNQRLYAGGSNSVRGWGSRELVPEKYQIDFGNSSREDLEAVLLKGVLPGGFFLIDGSIESRHKFWDRLGAAVFVDFGNTWNDVSEFQRVDQIAIAVGFGFRYYSDFIPFRIDFGFKAHDPRDPRSMFKKQLWGELLQFHIGIGEAF